MKKVSDDEKSVSYLIPVRNPDEGLLISINSICQNKYLKEIIVVDDFSNRGADIFKQIQALPKVRVFKNKYEVGISGALNTGLSEAGGDYIARLDSGDQDLVSRLEKQVALMDGHDLVVAGMVFSSKGRNTNWKMAPKLHFVGGVLSPWSRLPHPTWLVRRKAIQHYYVAKDFRCEDYGFVLRNNFRVALLNEPVVSYAVSDRLNRRKELFSVFIKTNLFLSKGRLNMKRMIVGCTYLFARCIRVILYDRKHSMVLSRLKGN